jgi:hypothetical protein
MSKVHATVAAQHQCEENRGPQCILGDACEGDMQRDEVDFYSRAQRLSVLSMQMAHLSRAPIGGAVQLMVHKALRKCVIYGSA